MSLNYYNILLGDSSFFLWWLAAFAILSFFCFRKYVFSIFDPWFNVVAQLVLSCSVLAFFSYIGKVPLDLTIYFYLCFFSFWLGLNVFYTNNKVSNKPRNYFSSSQMKLLCYLLLAVNIVSVGIMCAVNGVPILSGDPNATKVTVHEGVGLFSRIKEASGLLLIAFALTAGFIYKQNHVFFMSTAWMILAGIISGSKGALFVLFFSFALAYYFVEKYYGIKKKKNIIYLLAVMALIWIFVVALVSSSYTQASSFDSVSRRIVLNSDGLYGYFVNGAYQEFLKESFWAKVQYYFADIIMALRVFTSEKIPNFGYLIKLYSGAYTSWGFAPNPTMFVDGHILFGYGGIAYCFLIGVLMSFSRYRVNNMILFVYLGLITRYLIGDGALFFSCLFDCLLIMAVLVFGVMAADRSLYNKDKSVAQERIVQKEPA